MRHKDKQPKEGSAPEQVAPSTAASMITPLDIQQKEFQVSRFGGYRMRDVDEFLDQLTDAMTAALAENERLRAGASPSLLGTPDLDEVSRQADEIIQRARDEAARILNDARRRSDVASGIAQGDRQAVDAFLAREREFLQRLAALVQEHADGMKAMAREVRRRPIADAEAPAISATAADAPDAPGRPTDVARELDEAPPTDERRESAADRPSASEPEPTRPIEVPPPADEPIIVSERERSSTRRDDDDRDDTLRELFWGEES